MEDFTLPKNTYKNDIYAAKDWLAVQQPFIGRMIASRHLDNGSMGLYDLSCSYYYGIRWNFCLTVRRAEYEISVEDFRCYRP